MIYETLVWLWMAVGALAGLYLLRVPAPSGRHTSPAWGPLVDNRLGWFVMEAVVLLVFWGLLLRGSLPGGPARAMILLFTFHYLNRAFIYPFRTRTRGKGIPLLIVLSAVGFNVVNGSLLAWHFAHRASYPDTWWTDWRFVSGVLLFAAGLGINWWADGRLIALREPGQTGYSIPRGGLFDLVSCPNHLGEILEWTGFAILTWSLPGVAFAFWTVANLVPRALSHDGWYRRTFNDYPASRKAVVPLVL